VSSPAPVHLFVYGSLRADAQAWTTRAAAPHAALAAAADLEGTASVAGRLHAVAWYPALVPARDGNRVRGEVWRIRDLAVLDLLDAFEGSEYARELHPAALDDGPEVTAFLYRYLPSLEGVPLIPSGDYLDWVRSPT
jgi:gamma-glutamylcyclotransferase (GGCT)/AIG2-like uncharacterized protein YtfP